MSPLTALILIGGYFTLLFLIAQVTAGKADSQAFFSANNHAPWYLVAFGMIGTSLSGVTFISVPGDVGKTQFTYMALVLGYILGYTFIGLVLLPLYYRLNLVSIYTYLEQRLGWHAYKTGAAFFLISRTLGSAARFYLVLGVLHYLVLQPLGVGFELSAILGVALIWLYTYKGGMKTIVITDTLQTFFMLSAVGISIYLVAKELGMGLGELGFQAWTGAFSKVVDTEVTSRTNVVKQVLSGAFIAIVMTGLDQDMMQKNLTCRNLADAQKNMFWFTITLVVVNAMFLTLGAAMYMFAEAKGIALPAKTDQLFPMLAHDHFSVFAYVAFLLGIIAATYASTDSALTALTTSFCIDFLAFGKRDEGKAKDKLRVTVHLGFSALLVLVVLLFHYFNQDSLITAVFKLAALTYGPLLGLFAFCLFTPHRVKGTLVSLVALAGPIMSYLLREFGPLVLGGYQFGYELLLINGALVYAGLWLIRRPHHEVALQGQ